MTASFRLAFASVHVDDLARARPFYERVLGLRVARDGPPGEVYYDLGGALLCVHADPERACGRAPGGATGLYLQVDDLAAARAALERAGGRVSWSEGNAFSLEDPEGNELVFWQPREPWPPTH